MNHGIVIERDYLDARMTQMLVMCECCGYNLATESVMFIDGSRFIVCFRCAEEAGQ